MTDQAKEIPSWAFISAQIVQQAVHTEYFALCVRSVEEQYGLEPGAFGNGFFRHSHVASLLYCLIVVPKEVWDLPENHRIYSNIAEDWLLRIFEIHQESPLFRKHPVYYLIHHLRNAVAHVHFSIADDGRFTFWDQKNKTSDRHFQATVTLDGLQEFLSKVGALLANLRSVPFIESEDKA